MQADNWRQQFSAPWWLGNGHSQTLYRKFRAPGPVAHRRQRIELSDGDFIDLDWAEASRDKLDNSDVVVLLVHGLCGCSESPYIAALQSSLDGGGIPSVAMNLRGCSGEPNRLARTYHSGASSDLDEVYSKLKSEHADKEFIVVGYSLGANILLKWLGESESQAQLRLAIAVSTPFQLADCSRAMLSGFSRVYGRYFVRRLQAGLANKIEHLQRHQDGAELNKLQALNLPRRYSNIWEFDDRVTAPLHGFADAGDYYRQCSSAAFLPAIRANTCLIQSADDPLIPATVIPSAATLGNHFELRLSEQGGHVGFIDSYRPSWLEKTITDLVSA